MFRLPRPGYHIERDYVAACNRLCVKIPIGPALSCLWNRNHGTGYFFHPIYSLIEFSCSERAGEKKTMDMFKSFQWFFFSVSDVHLFIATFFVCSSSTIHLYVRLCSAYVLLLLCQSARYFNYFLWTRQLRVCQRGRRHCGLRAQYIYIYKSVIGPRQTVIVLMAVFFFFPSLILCWRFLFYFISIWVSPGEFIYCRTQMRGTAIA